MEIVKEEVIMGYYLGLMGEEERERERRE